MRKILMAGVIACLISAGFSFLYYDGRINKYEEALIGKTYLLPPTDEEYQEWSNKMDQQMIKNKERELNLLKQGIRLNAEDVNHNSIDVDVTDANDPDLSFPNGHNPPADILQSQINGLRIDRNNAVIVSLMGSVIFTLALYATLYKQTRK